MKKCISVVVLVLFASGLIAQPGKLKVPILEETNQIIPDKGESIKPGQINKSGTWYYFAVENEEDEVGRLCRIKVDGAGEFDGDVEYLKVSEEDENLDMSKPSLSGDDKIIVFSSADGSWGSNDLYIGKLDAQANLTEVRLLEEINLEDDADAYPWISPDGLHIYWCREGAVMHSYRSSTTSKFRKPVEIEIGESVDQFDPVSVWLTADMKEIYVMSASSMYATKRKNLKTDFGELQLIAEDIGGEVFISGASFNAAKSNLYVYWSDDEAVIQSFKVNWK